MNIGAVSGFPVEPFPQANIWKIWLFARVHEQQLVAFSKPELHLLKMFASSQVSSMKGRTAMHVK